MTIYAEVLSDLDPALFDPKVLAELQAEEALVGALLQNELLRRVGLLQWLSTTTVPELRRVAGLLGWALEGRDRKAIVRQMLDHYRSPASLEAAWHRLSEADQNLLSLLTVLTPQDSEMIDDRLESGILTCPTDWPSPEDPAVALRSLIDAGYVHEMAGEQVDLVFVSEGFTDVAPPPPLLRKATVAGHSRAQVIEAEAAVWTAHLALRDETASGTRRLELDSDYGSPLEWPQDENSWGISTGGAQPDEDEVFAVLPDLPSPFSDDLRDVVRDETGVADVGVARFYLTLALVLEQARLPDAAADTLADPMDGVLGMPHLLGAWARSGFLSFDELALARERGAQFHIMQCMAPWHSPGSYSSLLAQWRAMSVSSLSLLLPAPGNDEGWVEARDFLTLLQDLWPHAFARPLEFATTLLFDEEHGAVQPDGKPENHRRIREIWTAMWQGPMRWLGLVETACEADGVLRALRLTPAGADFCGHSRWVTWDVPHTTTPAGAEDDLRWEEDLGFSLPIARSGALRSRLSRWAELEGVSDGRARYRLSSRRAGSAFEAGHSPADLRATLERHGQALPTAHGEALDRWWTRRGLLHHYEDLAVVELASALLQRELLADARTARLILHPIGERALAVRSSQVAPLLERLEQRGYRPMVVGGET